MHRKRKFNEINKGVFKNDKKSCLVDLKPLQKLNQLKDNKEEKNEEDIAIQSKTDKNINMQNNETTKLKKKNLEINLRVSKNLGFGTFFKKIREEITDIFMSSEEYISFDGLFNFNQLPVLFNNINKHDKITSLENMSTNCYKDQGEYDEVQGNMILEEEEQQQQEIQEEILFENESETIIKRKKITPSDVDLEYLNNFEIDKIKKENIYTHKRNININGIYNKTKDSVSTKDLLELSNNVLSNMHNLPINSNMVPYQEINRQQNKIKGYYDNNHNHNYHCKENNLNYNNIPNRKYNQDSKIVNLNDVNSLPYYYIEDHNKCSKNINSLNNVIRY